MMLEMKIGEKGHFGSICTIRRPDREDDNIEVSIGVASPYGGGVGTPAATFQVNSFHFTLIGPDANLLDQCKTPGDAIGVAIQVLIRHLTVDQWCEFLRLSSKEAFARGWSEGVANLQTEFRKLLGHS